MLHDDVIAFGTQLHEFYSFFVFLLMTLANLIVSLLVFFTRKTQETHRKKIHRKAPVPGYLF